MFECKLHNGFYGKRCLDCKREVDERKLFIKKTFPQYFENETWPLNKVSMKTATKIIYDLYKSKVEL